MDIHRDFGMFDDLPINGDKGQLEGGGVIGRMEKDFHFQIETGNFLFFFI